MDQIQSIRVMFFREGLSKRKIAELNGQDYEARGALIRACLERQIKAPLRVVAVTWVHDPMAARRAEQVLFSREPGLT